jgi:hypothetical protein
MGVSSDTTKKRRRERVKSSHVAPRGQREKVARPAERVPSTPAAPAARRRRPKRSRDADRRVAANTASMTQRRGAQFDLVFSARMLSLVLLVMLSVVLFVFFQSDVLYVHHIEVGGLYHLTAEEVFTLSGVANTHLFWVDPVQIRDRIMESPSVADVEVLVNWPPHLVQIEVQEREPALIWEQAGVRTWIDVRGRVMQQRTDLEGLLRIMVEESDEPLGAHMVIPQEVVDGALQLRTLYPNIEMLRYDSHQGLGYQDVRGWRVWFGSGTNMPAKVNMYDAIVADLEARNIQPEYIDVGEIDAPYYKVWWGRDADTNAEDATPPADS